VLIGFIGLLYDAHLLATDPKTGVTDGAKRKADVAPVLDRLYAWIAGERLMVTDDSPIAKAMNYLVNHKVPLTRFLDDGLLRLDSRVGDRRGGVQAALVCVRRFRLRARVARAITPSPVPASSNRTGGFPASGSPRRRHHIGFMIPSAGAPAFAAA